jgi:hypothetical protein
MKLCGKSSEAQTFQDEARATLDEICAGRAAYLSIATLDEEAIYDHIVSFDAGRPSLGLFQQPGKTPKLNEICCLINERLAATGDLLSVTEMASVLRVDHTPIPFEFFLLPR